SYGCFIEPPVGGTTQFQRAPSVWVDEVVAARRPVSRGRKFPAFGVRAVVSRLGRSYCCRRVTLYAHGAVTERTGPRAVRRWHRGCRAGPGDRGSKWGTYRPGVSTGRTLAPVRQPSGDGRSVPRDRGSPPSRVPA